MLRPQMALIATSCPRCLGWTSLTRPPRFPAQAPSGCSARPSIARRRLRRR
jgi:hypothetical protein